MNKDNSSENKSYADIRKEFGEAYMMCRECGSRLWSFDGNEDSDRDCPYKKNGECDPR